MGAATCVGVERIPCFACCGYEEERSAQRQRLQQTFRTARTPSVTVELAVSALAGLKGAAGYHTSIVVGGEEYVFTPMGIVQYDTIMSHKKNPEMQVNYVGHTRYSGADLIDCLDPHFPPDHYDLLRKNCNSFSDCALYFLCEQRLDPGFRKMERIGKFADDHVGLLQSISGGEYHPNPHSIYFDIEKVIAEIDADRDTCDGGSADAELDFPESEGDFSKGNEILSLERADPLEEIAVDSMETSRSAVWGGPVLDNPATVEQYTGGVSVEERSVNCTANDLSFIHYSEVEGYVTDWNDLQLNEA